MILFTRRYDVNSEIKESSFSGLMILIFDTKKRYDKKNTLLELADNCNIISVFAANEIGNEGYKGKASDIICKDYTSILRDIIQDVNNEFHKYVLNPSRQTLGEFLDAVRHDGINIHYIII